MELIWFILAAYGLTGFWVGVFLWSLNGATELFNFEYNLINAFICGCVSSGTSYFLSMLLDDFGLKVNRGGDSQ